MHKWNDCIERIQWHLKSTEIFVSSTGWYTPLKSLTGCVFESHCPPPLIFKKFPSSFIYLFICIFGGLGAHTHTHTNQGPHFGKRKKKVFTFFFFFRGVGMVGKVDIIWSRLLDNCMSLCRPGYHCISDCICALKACAVMIRMYAWLGVGQWVCFAWWQMCQHWGEHTWYAMGYIDRCRAYVGKFTFYMLPAGGAMSCEFSAL